VRITNQMMWQDAVRSVRANLATLNAAQAESLTGLKIRTMSDNPVDATLIMRIDASLADIDQFRRNGQSATTRLSAENVALTSVRDLLQQIHHLAIAAQASPPGDPLRLSALDQIQKVKDQIVALGNTQVGDDYIFAGGRSTAPAFLADGTYVGDSRVHAAEIDSSVQLDTNHTGDAVLTPVFQALDALSVQLTSGNGAAVSGAVASLGTVEEQTLAFQTEAGARMSVIKSAADQLGQRSQDLLDRRGAVRDADPAESVMKVTSAQNALERAYAVIGKMTAVNILDYLK
jgi:flagellar hook-associated protein 3 FlgL